MRLSELRRSEEGHFPSTSGFSVEHGAVLGLQKELEAGASCCAGLKGWGNFDKDTKQKERRKSLLQQSLLSSQFLLPSELPVKLLANRMQQEAT